MEDWKRQSLKEELEGNVLYVTRMDVFFNLTAERLDDVNELRRGRHSPVVAYKAYRSRL